jgi:hypothetical protein
MVWAISYFTARQGLNVVGHGGRNLPPWGMARDVYFSKFFIRLFIFRKSKQNKYKKIQRPWCAPAACPSLKLIWCDVLLLYEAT